MVGLKRGSHDPKPANAPILADLIQDEARRFVVEHPRSCAMSRQSADVWRGEAPMHWMTDWASPCPIFAAQGVGAQVTDIDGKLYDDFCLADTPAMFGHGQEAVAGPSPTRPGAGPASCCPPPAR